MPAVATSLALRASRATAVALPGRVWGDERFALGLLLAPFLIVAASLAGQQVLRSMSTTTSPIVVTSIDPRPMPAPLPAPVAPPAKVEPVAPARRPHSGRLVTRALPPLSPLELPLPTIAAAPPIPLPPPTVPRKLVKLALPPLAQLELPLPTIAAAPPVTLPKAEAAPAALPKTAALDPATRPAPARPEVLPSPEPLKRDDRPTPAIILPPLAGTMTPETAPQCHAKPDLLTRAVAMRSAASPVAGDPKRFGAALAAAARAQIDDLTIYNPKYVRIGFPNGDVAPLFGVCTDVIVRAYRALNIDLQSLVQQTRTGRGDPHIDHRRVDVLKKFFEKHGEVLAISEFAEDYRPGDIVTYWRPQNRTSTQHIAIVTDIIAPSGRPLIVHNRGWGTQLEDALFVDKITGHFRFAGIAPQTAVASAEAEVSPPRTVPAGRTALAPKRTSAQRP